MASQQKQAQCFYYQETAEEHVNKSCNHNGGANIFDRPECVIDAYLDAINGGTSRDEKIRSISQKFVNSEQLGNYNCNHNTPANKPPGYCGGCHKDECGNSDPNPNQSACGCNFGTSGAGAGSAEGSYDSGFNDKKRDHTCPCSSPEAKRSHAMGTSSCGSECPYASGLINKKAMSSCCTGLSEVEYKPEDVNNKPTLPSCCCEGGPYEKDLVNKKPSICSPCGPEAHPPCPAPREHCHQGEYRTRPQDIRDRRCFYSDEECGNTAVLKRCNNNS